jgi:hypothetical protein
MKFKSILATALLVGGCTDLDVAIKSQYTSFPESETAAEAVSADIYNAYRGAYGTAHWMANTLSTDEAVSVAMGSDYYDGGIYRQYVVHDWNRDNGYLNTMWNSAMTGVTSCNKVLALLGNEESDVSAPVRAMRAFYFFLLMDNFGAVPLIKSMGGEQQDRAPRAEIARFIESELLAVKDKLTTDVNASTYGKATRYMAEALLAKLYLNWNVYTAADVATYNPSAPNEKLNEAVKMCDAVIASGKFNLSDKFLVKFRPDNGPHIKDFIFVMPYDRERQQGLIYARYWIHRSAQKQFGDLPQSVGGTHRALPEFLAKFSLPGDERNKSYIGGPQYYWENYAPTTRPFLINTSKRGIDQDYNGADADVKFDWQMEFSKEITLRPDGAPTLNVGNDQKGRSMGYRSIKFYMDVNVTAAQNRSQSNDVPIFRLADIYLMKAEAILRGAAATNGDSPASLMNKIRTYVGAPAVTGTPTLDELLDERAREFADESWRRNDLIRFGKFEDNWGFKSLYPAGFTERFRRIFPVPRDVMNVNTNWKQNPGY